MRTPEQQELFRKVCTDLLKIAEDVLETEEKVLLAFVLGLRDGHEYSYEELSEFPEYPDDPEEVRVMVRRAMAKALEANHKHNREYLDQQSDTEA